MTGVGLEPTTCGLKVDHSQCTNVYQCPLMQIALQVFDPAPAHRFALVDVFRRWFGHNLATVRAAILFLLLPLQQRLEARVVADKEATPPLIKASAVSVSR